MRHLILAITLFWALSLSAQTEYKLNDNPNGFSISSRSNAATTIVHNVNAITIENSDRKDVEGQFITLSGVHISNTAGAPDMPSGSTFVAIPNGATPSIKMVNAKTKTIGNIDLIPAPQPQLDDDNSPAVYEKDMNIYGRNAFYPATPYNISEVMTVRGVEMVQVGVMPFQYNPVTKELIVYEDLELELSTEGGDGTFGDIRYRTPEWDQILSDMLLNREVLPKVDYGEKLRKHYENRETGCEYLIITPDNEEFVQLADSIKQFRTDQGIPTEVYTVTQCGGNDYTTLRNFIKNAYNNWDMPPAAMLILGDHNTDGTQGVVSYSMDNHPGGDGYNPYISDHKYAVMGNNHMPNIIIGRITGRNYDELYHMIKKDLDYERTPPTNPNFYDKPITAMGFQLERWFQLCSEVVNGFWEHELGKHPVRVNAIYQGTPGSQWSSAKNTNTIVNYFGPNRLQYIPQNMSHLTDWSGTGNDVNDAINSGAFILQHRDHGAEELWGEPRYSISHINRLTNNDLTYVMSNNCLTGRFNYGGTNGQGCFAEVFHRHEHGALGLIAATQVSYSFVNDVYVWGVYDNMWPDFMPDNGTEHPTNFILPAFGNAAGKYFLKKSSWTDNSVKEITYYLFHHHGDTYMNLYSEMPQQLDVEMLPVLVAGSGQYQIKVDEGATICLTANGQIIGFCEESTGATQYVTVTPQLPGTTVKLTIKKQNYYRYEHLLNTIPAEGPYLIFNSVQINDVAGNGNQNADFNETCDLNVSIHNVGTEGISDLTATLSCPNSKVQILQNQTTYGSIEPNAILQANNGFTVHFDESLENQETVRLYIEMSSGNYCYHDSIDIKVNAPVLNCTHVGLSNLEGEPTDRFLKGETSLMTFDITNSGSSRSLGLTNTLDIQAPFLDIVENPVYVESVDPGDTIQVSFQVNIQDNAPKGNILDYSFNVQSGVRTFQTEAQASLGYTSEDFENETLNPNLSWNLGNGTKKWHIVEDSTATEGYCLKSPYVAINNYAKLVITFTCTMPEVFSFLHKTSAGESNYLELELNGIVVDKWYGESDWELSTYDLYEGINIIVFKFRKKAQGDDDHALLDHLLFPPMEDLYIFAGDDTESCPNIPFTPNSGSLYAQEILWSSNGDGSFDDLTLEQPTYTFGANDRENGMVTLTMTATGSNQQELSEDVSIILLESVEGTALDAPQGNAEIDLRLNTESTYLTDFEDDVDYTWLLEPSQAGILIANGKQVDVQWNPDYRGTAELSFLVSDDCGDSEISHTLNINVFNSTSVNENGAITIEILPNPVHDQVHIKANGLGNGETLVRVFDVLGRVVHATNASSVDGAIDLQLNTSKLPGGIYEVQLTSEGKTHNTRLIVR